MWKMFLNHTICLSLIRRLGWPCLEQFPTSEQTTGISAGSVQSVFVGFFPFKTSISSSARRVRVSVCKKRLAESQTTADRLFCCDPLPACRSITRQTLFIWITPLRSVSAGEDTDFHSNTSVKYSSESSRVLTFGGWFYPRHITVRRERLRFLTRVGQVQIKLLTAAAQRAWFFCFPDIWPLTGRNVCSFTGSMWTKDLNRKDLKSAWHLTTKITPTRML